MPRFDGTGPLGQGSQTGRRLGRCRKNNPEDHTLTAERGVGSGFRMRFHANDRAGFTGHDKVTGRGRGAGRGLGRSRKDNNQ